MPSTDRIVFLVPPFFRLLGSQNRRMLPGIHSLAEAAAQAGYEAVVFNADYDPAAGNEYADWYSIAHNWNAYRRAIAGGHPAFDEMVKEVEALEPSAIVVSSGDVVLPTVDLGSTDCARAAVEHLKTRLPNLYVVGYGPQVTFNVEHSLEWADSVIRFEGEKTLVPMLQERPRGRVVDGGNLTGEELDHLPFHDPARLHRKVDPMDLDYIVRTRGCTYACSFCLTPMLGRKLRRSSMSRFLDEVEFRNEKYGVKWFYFADMIFEPHKASALEMCAEMIKRGFPEKGIGWCCESRVDTIDREKAEAMKAAGCKQLKLGAEAGTDEQLEAMGKRITTKQIRECYDMLRQVGMKISTYVILGQVGATRDTYERSYDFLKDLQSDYYVVNVAVPYKGTPLYAQLEPELQRRGLGLEGKEYHSHLSNGMIDFWGLDLPLVEKYLELSGSTSKGKEDGALRRFVRRLL